MKEALLRVRKKLARAGLPGIEVSEKMSAVILTGRVNSWEKYIRAGYAAAGEGFRGVVNDLEAPGAESGSFGSRPKVCDNALEGRVFDAVVVGGGVIGCAIARELTRWQFSVALLEKEEDVARHASGRNNGMVHSAMADRLGSKKQRYNLLGNRAYRQAADELGFDIMWPGSLGLLDKSWHLFLAPIGRKKARQKGVRGFKALTGRQVEEIEPNAGRGQRGAFYLPETGVVVPYKVTVAYAENALQNGAEFYMDTLVSGFDISEGRIKRVLTNRGALKARVVINAAGAWADHLAWLAGDRFFTIHPRKGVIAVLDKKTGPTQKHVFGHIKLGGRSRTKGGGLTPLVDGNIIAGPTATEVPGREDYKTSSEELDFITANHLSMNSALSRSDIITYFAGIRACTFEEDFVIEPSRVVDNLVHAAGIQSPGLASAPAIAADAAAMAAKILASGGELRANPSFNPRREKPPYPAALSLESKNKLIGIDPAYGRMVCRCEMVSEGEILKAIHSSLPARSMDALKRRVRTGMGRCQGGFCTPAVLKLLARETGRPVTDVCKSEAGSELISKMTRPEVEGCCDGS